MVSDISETVRLLPGVDDVYGGVMVDMSTPMDVASFVSSLRASIEQWKKHGKKGVWIKLPIDLVHLVQPAVQEGFWYHHAESNYLMLVYWIPETAHTLPVNATHRVYVGAIVMNAKGEMLVVKEKSGRFGGTGIWKIPIGAADEGEDISAGAIREVKEETGIDAEFLEVLAFRFGNISTTLPLLNPNWIQSSQRSASMSAAFFKFYCNAYMMQKHKSFFAKSDLFFLCILNPLSFDIQRQESEIEAAQWMPLDEFAAQPTVQKDELLKHIPDICLAKASGKGYTGFVPVLAKSFFSGQQKCSWYLNRRDLSQPSSSDNGS